MVPDAELRTYYDRPILKAPVWKWYIPAYFFTGGVAGGSAVLALGARVTGNRPLARRSRLAGLAALAVSGALLVADLGKPGRFANMLRVFKPSSPMSVGSWLLGAAGTAAAAGAASDLLGIAPGVGAVADLVAGAAGPAVSTYTAVLLADTANPAWHDARRELPFLFAGSAAASAAGLAVVLVPSADAGPAVRLLAAGAAVELAAFEALRRRLGPELAETYSAGLANKLGSWSRVLVTEGALTAVLGRRHRLVAAAGGLAVAAGCALGRFAVVEAGRAAARDPRYVVGPQRRAAGI